MSGRLALVALAAFIYGRRQGAETGKLRGYAAAMLDRRGV